MNEPINPEVAIFNGALELAPAERAAYLEQACAGNIPLRERVEALLNASEQAGSFLESPPTGLSLTRTVRIPITEKPGDKIGRYKLLQQIGEGGCGVVYMAEQEEPVRRRVALKVIKLGMDTKEVIARFEAERQALAMMDHPNIAKVLDAGATDAGRPYFVMELVRGIKITEFCDENKMPTEERLKLFMQVCQAIQHAHQKGIIHRDIKPSNILVTINDGVPVPKVIDFGIAKATQGRLTDSTLFTAFEQFIGTPAYMSPEQAMMTSLDIDTRTDVYSLGVLLYELLTGKTPFEADELLQSGFDAMRQMIREKEPQRPSARLSTMAGDALTTTASQRQTHPPKLLHMVRGDLDWIVMKSLEKDRSRRYETANGLAADILRHLKNEAIVAHPPSGLYRLQKAVQRNKTAFAAAGAIAAVLVTGVVVSTWEAIRAKRAEEEQTRLRRVAESKEKKSEQVAQFLKDMLQGVGPSVAMGRDTTMLREILDKTADRVGKDLKEQPEVEGELRSVIGNTYSALGKAAQAVAMHRETLEIYKKLYGNENVYVASAMGSLSEALSAMGDQIAAESTQREVLSMRRKLLGNEHPGVARSLDLLAVILLRESQGSPEAVRWRCMREAEATEREALALHRKLDDGPLGLVEPLDNLGVILEAQGKLPEAEIALREALTIKRKLTGNEDIGLIGVISPLADVLMDQSKYAEAETLYRETLALSRKFYGNEHPLVGFVLGHFGDLLQREDNLAESESALREAVSIYSKARGSGKLYHPYLARTLFDLAILLCDRGNLAESEKVFRETMDVATKTSEGVDEIVRFLNGLTGLLQQEGKTPEAEKLIGDMLENARESKSESGLLSSRGDLRAREGRWNEAATDYSRAVELNPAETEPSFTLAFLLLKAGRYDEYRRHCHEFLTRIGNGRAAKASLFLPVDGPDFALACQQASVVDEPNAPRWRAWAEVSKALAENRQGHFDSVTPLIEHVLATSEADLAFKAQACFIQASGFAHLKQLDSARAALARGNELVARPRGNIPANFANSWREWAIADFFCDEAKALIKDLAATPSAPTK